MKRRKYKTRLINLFANNVISKNEFKSALEILNSNQGSEDAILHITLTEKDKENTDENFQLIQKKCEEAERALDKIGFEVKLLDINVVII